MDRDFRKEHEDGWDGARGENHYGWSWCDWENFGEELLSALEAKDKKFDILLTKSLELQNMCDAKDREIYLLRTEVEWLRESHNEELRERELEDEIR